MTATRSRDLDAFRAVVAPHLRPMGQLASRLTSVVERDDVVQASLAAAWRRRAEYDDTHGSALAWLLAIVVDRARRRRVSQPATDTALIDLPASALHHDRLADIDAAVASLPEEQRLAIELFYVLGLDVATCATVMACSQDTAATTLAAARRRLLDGVEEIELW